MKEKQLGRVFWFIGQPTTGKTTLAIKLYNFLRTEKRNWRRDVFHIESDTLRELYQNKDYTQQGQITNITNAQALTEYLYSNGCDVVVSLVTPYLDLREKFKEKLGDNIVEILIHSSEKQDCGEYFVKNFEHPESNFIDIDITKGSPTVSFSKLINNLIKINKI